MLKGAAECCIKRKDTLFMFSRVERVQGYAISTGKNEEIRRCSFCWELQLLCFEFEKVSMNVYVVRDSPL